MPSRTAEAIADHERMLVAVKSGAKDETYEALRTHLGHFGAVRNQDVTSAGRSEAGDADPGAETASSVQAP